MLVITNQGLSSRLRQDLGFLRNPSNKSVSFVVVILGINELINHSFQFLKTQGEKIERGTIDF